MRGLILLVVMCVSSGCFGVQETLRRGDLDIAVSRHHIDLRWGRVPHAARFVHPDLQDAFIRDWEKRISDYQIQDIQVLEVYTNPKGTRATVLIQVNLINKNTQTLQAMRLQEEWELVDNHWIAIRPADLAEGTEVKPQGY